MDDLISRAALLKSLNEQAPKPTTDDLYTVNLCIINAPAVSAVPVVRCRDCKWWEEGQTTDGVKGFCPISGCCEGPEFYCADGERRNSE